MSARWSGLQHQDFNSGTGDDLLVVASDLVEYGGSQLVPFKGALPDELIDVADRLV